jgi:hypothetical protein
MNTKEVFIGITKKEKQTVFAMHIPERKYRVIMTYRQFVLLQKFTGPLKLLDSQQYAARVGRLKALAHRSGPPSRRRR